MDSGARDRGHGHRLLDYPPDAVHTLLRTVVRSVYRSIVYAGPQPAVVVTWSMTSSARCLPYRILPSPTEKSMSTVEEWRSEYTLRLRGERWETDARYKLIYGAFTNPCLRDRTAFCEPTSCCWCRNLHHAVYGLWTMRTVY